MFSRVFEFLENLRPKTACMLPNVARYQLRHTPRMYRIIIADEKIFVKRQAKIRLPLFQYHATVDVAIAFCYGRSNTYLILATMTSASSVGFE